LVFFVENVGNGRLPIYPITTRADLIIELLGRANISDPSRGFLAGDGPLKRGLELFVGYTLVEGTFDIVLEVELQLRTNPQAVFDQADGNSNRSKKEIYANELPHEPCIGFPLNEFNESRREAPGANAERKESISGYTCNYTCKSMAKKLTITIDESVYNGLYRVIGPRKISGFIEDLVRPHVTDLNEAYRDMASDEERERDANEWTTELEGDTWQKESEQPDGSGA
jgi:predicted CopG family antitoxin